MRPTTRLAARRPLVLLFLVSLLAPVLAACGGPSAGDLGGKSANQVLALAKAGAQKEGSFSFVDTAGTGTKKQVLIGNISTSGNSEENLTSPNGTLQVRLVGKALFVYASQLVLEDALNLSSTAAHTYAEKWISMQSTNAPYQTVLKAIRPSSELTPYLPVSGLKVENVQSLRGISVLPVTGKASSSTSGTANATLFVSTTTPYVPVGGALIGTGSEKNDTEIVAFKSWGAKFTVKAPSGVVAYSSIPTS